MSRAGRRPYVCVGCLEDSTVVFPCYDRQLFSFPQWPVFCSFCTRPFLGLSLLWPVGLWDSSIDVCVWEEDFASRIITQYDGTNVLRQQINELLVACFVVVCWWWRGWCGVFSVRTCLVNVIGVVNDHILTDFSSLKTISIILYYFQFIGGISMFRIS